jgi:hypothetical protein
MNRLVTWARFGTKSKEQLQQPKVQPHTAPPPPEGGQEKEKAEEAADPPPCRDSLDHRFVDVGQPDDTPPSSGEDMVTPKAGAVIEVYVAVPYSHNPRNCYSRIRPTHQAPSSRPLIPSNFFASDADLSLRPPGRHLSYPSTP